VAEENKAANDNSMGPQLLEIPGGYARLAVIASLVAMLVMALMGDGTPDSHAARYLLGIFVYVALITVIDRWGKSNGAHTYWLLVARLNFPAIRNLGLFAVCIHMSTPGGFMRASLLVKLLMVAYIMINALEVFFRLRRLRKIKVEFAIAADGALLDLLMAMLLCAIYTLNGFGEFWGKIAAYSCVCIWISNLAATLRRFHFAFGSKVYSSWKTLLICLPLIWASFALAFFGYDFVNGQVLTAFAAFQGLWFLLAARFARMPS
jgi:hypothetical protein